MTVSLFRLGQESEGLSLTNMFYMASKLIRQVEFDNIDACYEEVAEKRYQDYGEQAESFQY